MEKATDGLSPLVRVANKHCAADFYFQLCLFHSCLWAY